MIKKVLKLLTALERKRLLMLIGVMIVSAIVEVAGIASIMPFLGLITNPGMVQENKILHYFYTALNFKSTNRYLIFVGVIVLFILIVSNLLVFTTNWGLARFSWMRSHSISSRLLFNYLYQPYKFFLNQNTALLGKNILSEVSLVVKGVFIPFLDILSRGIVAIFIFTMLVIVKPLLALSLIIILGGAYTLTYRIIKHRLNIIGKVRHETNAYRFKAINEAFGDIKLVKLMGYENFFIKRYSLCSVEYAKSNATNNIIELIPKYIVEVLAFGGIIVVVLYLLATGGGLGELLPLIGLYAFSMYRLLPSIQAIFAGTAMIRFNSKALDALYFDMFSFSNTDIYSSNKKIQAIPFKKELKFENVTFIYPEAAKPIIKNLNIKIDINTSVAFVGVTGAGKTTLANIILGLLKPDSGRITVDGTEINDENTPSWQKNLGYIPQDIYLQDDTIKRNITFGIPDQKVNIDSVIQAAKIANIHDFIENQLPDKYDTIVGERGVRLSGGQKQRIGIARAIYSNPGVLVLDEATSALDGATEKDVFKAIENIAKTKTLIIIAHRLTTIQDCDVIYVMDNGNMVGEGTYNDLMESNKYFRKIAGKISKTTGIISGGL
jgi:ATP-binding cassette, subfamily B, bacterial PglK